MNTHSEQCVYGHDFDIFCTKCLDCGECTNGSQLHKFCSFVDEPETFIEVCENKEDSLLLTDVQNMENNQIFDLTYRFYKVATSIYTAHEELTNEYPYEDFTSPLYTGIELHQYLTMEVTRKEFFLMWNQWEDTMINNKLLKDGEQIFMRINALVRDNGERECVYHVDCINSDIYTNSSSGYIKGILLTTSAYPQHFCKLVVQAPNLFFCHACSHFMFDTVEYSCLPLPEPSVWPYCNLYQTEEKNRSAIVSLTVEKHIQIIKPFIFVSKKQKSEGRSSGWLSSRRRLNFDE